MKIYKSFPIYILLPRLSEGTSIGGGAFTSIRGAVAFTTIGGAGAFTAIGGAGAFTSSVV
jgi:hypothetical protein